MDDERFEWAWLPGLRALLLAVNQIQNQNGLAWQAVEACRKQKDNRSERDKMRKRARKESKK